MRSNDWWAISGANVAGSLFLNPRYSKPPVRACKPTPICGRSLRYCGFFALYSFERVHKVTEFHVFDRLIGTFRVTYAHEVEEVSNILVRGLFLHLTSWAGSIGARTATPRRESGDAKRITDGESDRFRILCAVAREATNPRYSHAGPPPLFEG